MKQTEARELLGMLKAATSQHVLDDEGVTYWLNQFVILDADLATKTVLIGANKWQRFPSWAQFFEIYQVEKKKVVPERSAESSLPPRQKQPEWVSVWAWARWKRKPRNLLPFPQQKGYVDDTLAMSQEEYEALHAEWVSAGSLLIDAAWMIRERTLTAGGKSDYGTWAAEVLQDTYE